MTKTMTDPRLNPWFKRTTKKRRAAQLNKYARSLHDCAHEAWREADELSDYPYEF